MYYLLYKIKNLINGKIYVGIKGSKILSLGDYYGSGKLIKQAIKKYGLNNFERKIILLSEDENYIREKEREIVCESFLLSSKVYNLNFGGHGSFGY
jgi:hypothetical protein